MISLAMRVPILREAALAAGLLCCGCPGEPMTPVPDLAPGVRVLSFQDPMLYPSGSYPHDVALGDLSGDGLPDVAVARADSMEGQVVVLLNKGGGLLAPRVSFGTGDTPYAVVAADLNGDRKVDLGARRTGGRAGARAPTARRRPSPSGPSRKRRVVNAPIRERPLT